MDTANSTAPEKEQTIDAFIQLSQSLRWDHVPEATRVNVRRELLDVHPAGPARPQMVGDYNVSADSLTYSFKLRPGLKFHDGEPFNAEAAKYSLERHLNMKGSFRKPEIAAVDKAWRTRLSLNCLWSSRTVRCSKLATDGMKVQSNRCAWLLAKAKC